MFRGTPLRPIKRSLKKNVKKFVKFVKAFDKTENGVDTFLTFFTWCHNTFWKLKNLVKLDLKRHFYIVILTHFWFMDSCAV